MPERDALEFALWNYDKLGFSYDDMRLHLKLISNLEIDFYASYDGAKHYAEKERGDHGPARNQAG